MMPRVNREKLDQILAEAGVDEATATALRQANEADAQEQSRGHGTAVADSRPIDL